MQYFAICRQIMQSIITILTNYSTISNTFKNLILRSGTSFFQPGMWKSHHLHRAMIIPKPNVFKTVIKSVYSGVALISGVSSQVRMKTLTYYTLNRINF